jgi:hypothetical protein
MIHPSSPRTLARSSGRRQKEEKSRKKGELLSLKYREKRVQVSSLIIYKYSIIGWLAIRFFLMLKSSSKVSVM